MKNYSHRFACGVVGCVFISIGCVLRNWFGIYFTIFFENIGIHKNIIFAILACLTFGIAASLDNLVEKYEFTIEE